MSHGLTNLLCLFNVHFWINKQHCWAAMTTQVWLKTSAYCQTNKLPLIIKKALFKKIILHSISINCGKTFWNIGAFLAQIWPYFLHLKSQLLWCASIHLILGNWCSNLIYLLYVPCTLCNFTRKWKNLQPSFLRGLDSQGYHLCCTEWGCVLKWGLLYILQTRRALRIRIAEHRRSIIKS